MMLVLFAIPIVFAFANFVVSLQLGSPDVASSAVERVPLLAVLFGGPVVFSGFRAPTGCGITPAAAPDMVSNIGSASGCRGIQVDPMASEVPQWAGPSCAC
jgi:hypothetical protein